MCIVSARGGEVAGLGLAGQIQVAIPLRYASDSVIEITRRQQLGQKQCHVRPNPGQLEAKSRSANER